jgi:phage terminase large subunit
MLACYWIALDDRGRAYVYRELYRPDLIISQAAELIKAMTPPEEKIYARMAPPDLWNRRQDTGRSVAEVFAHEGVPLTKASNNRVMGWYDLQEWLRVRETEGQKLPGLQIFDCCSNLIRTLPALQRDLYDPNDCALTPHELTHAPDALRYFAAGRPFPGMQRPTEADWHFGVLKPKPDPLGKGDRCTVL